MSVEAMTWAFNDSEASGSDRLVLLVLANMASVHGDDDRHKCWPAVSKVAAWAKVSSDTVRRSLHRLEAMGEIEIGTNEGVKGTNVYTLNIPPSQNASPRTGNDDPSHSCEPNRKEQKERVTSPLPPTTKTNGKGLPPYSTTFERAWAAYPRKNDAKKAAFRVWLTRCRTEGHSPYLLLEATERYARRMRAEGREQQHMKMAQTFWGPDEHWKAELERPESDYSDVDPTWLIGQLPSDTFQ